MRLPALARNSRILEAGRHLVESLARPCSSVGADYDRLWRRDLLPWLQVSLVNRAIFEHCGNRGYAWLLRAQERTADTRRFLRRLYCPGRLRRLMLPWARTRLHRRRRDAACSLADAVCTSQD